MYCAVYKSPKKQDTYLYIQKKDDFSAVPEALLKSFGTPEFVLIADPAKRKKIAGIDVNSFLETFTSQGFYLQLPPKTESLLKTHRKQQS